MGRILLPSEKGDKLTEAEGELLFSSFYRASSPVTIAAGIISVPGSGRYAISPETGVEDDLTGITLSSEALDGAEVEIRPASSGITLHIIHSTTFSLANGGDVDLDTPRSILWMRYYGGGQWGQSRPALYVP